MRQKCRSSAAPIAQRLDRPARRSTSTKRRRQHEPSLCALRSPLQRPPLVGSAGAERPRRPGTETLGAEPIAVRKDPVLNLGTLVEPHRLDIQVGGKLRKRPPASNTFLNSSFDRASDVRDILRAIICGPDRSRWKLVWRAVAAFCLWLHARQGRASPATWQLPMCRSPVTRRVTSDRRRPPAISSSARRGVGRPGSRRYWAEGRWMSPASVGRKPQASKYKGPCSGRKST